jgi:predicted MFS family arabinose efflux permease
MNPSFSRDRLTWLAHLMLAYYAYVSGIFGPIMPFLRSELSLSYTQGGLHLTFFALGMILTGFFGSSLADRWGRKRILWGGSLGIALGCFALAFGRQVAITLLSALLMGISGSIIQFIVQAILSDRHGAWRAVALTEANIGAGLSSTLAPFLVAIFTRFALSWRTAFYLISVFLIALVIGFFRLAIPNQHAQGKSSSTPQVKSRLPLVFWGFWVSIIFFVAIEWCLMVWGAEFLIARFAFSKTAASAVMGLFMGLGVVSRVISSRLTRKHQPGPLLLVSLGVCLFGFLFFWLSIHPVLSIMGLCLAGLGVSNLFPLAMTLAVGSAPHQSDLASARISLAVGLAGGGAPLGLGRLADQVGLQAAYSALVVFLLAGILLTVILHRSTDQRQIAKLS